MVKKRGLWSRIHKTPECHQNPIGFSLHHDQSLHKILAQFIVKLLTYSNWQTDRPTDRQTDRQTDRHYHTTHIFIGRGNYHNHKACETQTRIMFLLVIFTSIKKCLKCRHHSHIDGQVTDCAAVLIGCVTGPARRSVCLSVSYVLQTWNQKLPRIHNKLFAALASTAKQKAFQNCCQNVNKSFNKGYSSTNL